MLTLERMTDNDVELAWGYSDPKFEHKIFTVYFTRRRGKSAIVSDDIRKLLRSEQLRILEEFNITPAEFRLLCRGEAGRGVLVAQPQEGLPGDPEVDRRQAQERDGVWRRERLPGPRV